MERDNVGLVCFFVWIIFWGCLTFYGAFTADEIVTEKDCYDRYRNKIKEVSCEGTKMQHENSFIQWLISGFGIFMMIIGVISFFIFLFIPFMREGYA